MTISKNMAFKNNAILELSVDNDTIRTSAEIEVNLPNTEGSSSNTYLAKILKTPIGANEEVPDNVEINFPITEGSSSNIDSINILKKPLAVDETNRQHLSARSCFFTTEKKHHAISREIRADKAFSI